jgi:hypothetical protein
MNFVEVDFSNALFDVANPFNGWGRETKMFGDINFADPLITQTALNFVEADFSDTYVDFVELDFSSPFNGWEREMTMFDVPNTLGTQECTLDGNMIIFDRDTSETEKPQPEASPKIPLIKLKCPIPQTIIEEPGMTHLERAEEVIDLLKKAGRTWLADLTIISKIGRARHTNKLIIWLDYPEDTPDCELDEFSINYDGKYGREGIGFYGRICRAEKFDPRGNLFITIGDKERRYKGIYKWNKAEVIQIFHRGVVLTKVETSRQVHESYLKKRRQDE